MASYRYVAPLQEPVLMPFDQRMAMANADLEKKKNTDALINDRLKQVYGFERGEEWDPVFVDGFGKLKTEVVRRLESGYYPNSAVFQQDLNSLATEWNKIDNMYRATKDATSRYINVMQNKEDNEDESTEIVETPELYKAKVRQAQNFGVSKLDVNLQDLSLGNAYFNMVGVTNDQGEPVQNFTGPLDQSPIYGRTDWLTPATAVRAYIQPESEADRFQTQAQRLFEQGKPRNQILSIISEQLQREYSSDPKKNAAVTRWWEEGEGMVAGESEELDAVKGFVKEVEKLISMYIDDVSGSGGGGADVPTRTIKDVEVTFVNQSNGQYLWSIDARNPVYDKDYSINFDGIIEKGDINEMLAAELQRADGTIDMSFIPTAFRILGDQLILAGLSTPTGKSNVLRTQPVLDFNNKEDKAVINQIERVMKRMYGEEFSFDSLRSGINFKEAGSAIPAEVTEFDWTSQ